MTVAFRRLIFHLPFISYLLPGNRDITQAFSFYWQQSKGKDHVIPLFSGNRGAHWPLEWNPVL